MQKTTKEIEQEKTAKAIEEFLANGGKITYVPSGLRGDQAEVVQKNSWGKKRKTPVKKKPT